MKNGNQQEAVQQDTSYDTGNVIWQTKRHYLKSMLKRTALGTSKLS